MNARTCRKAHALQILKIIWGAVSIALLILVFYYTKEQERIQNNQVIKYTTEIIGNKVDKLIHTLMQSVHTINIINSNDHECNQELLAELQQLRFNNPQLSGLVIRNNKQQVICSTLAKKNNPLIQPMGPLTMYGPVQLNSKEKPVFIIQKPLGSYFIDLYLLKQIVEQALKTEEPIAKRIFLYDEHQKKIILDIERQNKNAVWQTSNPSASIPHSLLVKSTSPMLTQVKISALNDVHLILVADPNNIAYLSWLHVLLISLLIISFSCFIYYYLRLIVNNHFSLNRAIRQAVKNNNFFPVYQPIFDIASNSYCGAEVLLRWQVNENETITPDFFIEEAEKSGLIVPITLQLIEKTFQQCRDLLQTNTPFHLALNLSAIHFTHTNFLDSLSKLCTKHQVSPHQLVLELTERDLLSQNDSLLIAKMNNLRLAGFSLAVDDFGTGYASIGYLQHFPFNYLKIDQLFIRAIGTGAITETLNYSIIHMAQNLKLHIIAEGVETYSQVEFLQTHGVDLMQGWYFANAMPIEQLLIFIQRSK